MGFSGIAVEQRSQEAVALRSFLVYSLMGSLALHAGVLASGVGNFLSRVPETKDEPIEVAIIETPQPQVTQTPQVEEKEEKPKIIEKSVFTPPVEPKPVKVEEPRPEPKNAPVQKIIPQAENREPTRQNSPKITSAVANQTSKLSSSARTEERAPSGGGGGGGSSVLTGSTGSGFASGTGRGTGIGTGVGSGIGSGSGSGVGSGNGTGSTNSNLIGQLRGIRDSPAVSRGGNEVAVAPKNPVIEAPAAPVNRSSGNGRAACRECNAKYPEAARRRGIEGRVEVAVDTDDQGNVTNVRVARSSGNRELDEETLRQARDWKLKPAAGGRRGVSIGTEFAIQGSRRHSEVQQRRQQREAEERNQQVAEETPRLRRRLQASSNTDDSGERIREPQTRRRRSLDAVSSDTESRISRRLISRRSETTSQSAASSGGGSLRDSLRRSRRERVVSDASPAQPTRKRRRRADQARPASQTRLIESLRRSRPEAPAAAPEAPAASE
ncbi:energy transducer TonB [Fortiea contorta]|uniref:energy transducer TonB n=1 Tax=Fortiea contorta TaxID=1892405 RepID=UPI00034CE95F|nr:energy transducer TonB [Fortiea contorta]